MSKPERDLSKLPKWAQQKIQKLRADVIWWKGKFEATLGGEGSTGVAVRTADGLMPLPEGTEVVFAVGERDGADDPYFQKVSFRLDEYGDIKVCANDRALAFIPSSSNAGKIRLVEF